MTKSVLFVGEDQPLWQEFSAQTRDPASGWAGIFARTQAEALDLIQHIAFNAAVADVQLMDSNGLEVLEEITERQPNCFTVVLSDFADTGSTLQCIGAGHHHLVKPCEATSLLRLLNREGQYRLSLPGAASRSLISQMKRVPSPPTIYLQVVAELQSNDASVEKVGDIISQDPAIAAKVMQLANSAVFGLHLQVLEPVEAVMYLGLTTTQSLVLLAHTFATFDHARLSGFSVQALWAHSLLTGRHARELASKQSAGQEVIAQSFTAGLLHDLGKLLLAANLPEQLGKAMALAKSRPCPLVDAELEVVGASHAEIGASLLDIWGLPEPIVEAVALHHHPASLVAERFTPLTATYAANIIAHSDKQGLGSVADDPAWVHQPKR
jgi:putative nucleotidyltransferase with HDIG domain